jgi:uncharacterized MAPEG superfamily protein
MNFFEQFQQLALPVGVIALLMHMQVLVLDVLGLRAKHLPGTPVEANHGSPIFRASRTVANTNETIAVFILALMFCVLAQATPFHTVYAAWGFVVSRILYAICYYSNLKLLRSVVFGISLLFLFDLLVIGMFW